MSEQKDTGALWPRTGRQKSMKELLAGLHEQAVAEREEQERLAAQGDNPTADETRQDPAGNGEGQAEQTREQPEHREVKEPSADAGTKQQADEIAKLRHELNSAQGRLKPTQQRLEAVQSENANLRAQLDTAQRRIADLEASQKELEELRHSRKASDVKARIQEQFPDVDPAYADAIVSAVSEFNQPKAETKPQHENTQTQHQQGFVYGQGNPVQDKMNQVLADSSRNIGSLRAMAGDPDFRDWVESRPEVGAVITVFTQSTSVSDVEKYAEQIDRYMDEYFDHEPTQPAQPTSTPVSNPPTGVSQHMTRNGNRKLSRSEYEKRRAEIIPKLRSRDVKVREQANRELSELQAQFRN